MSIGLVLPVVHLSWRVAVMVVALASLAACGETGSADKPASQTAARVNKEEITVHQINALLAQQRVAPGDRAEAASRAMLERLIEQELALQKAAELKIDRDPRVVQALLAARRDIIARAYSEKISENVGKPSPAEVKAYYQSHPALFAERRIYQISQFAVEADIAQIEALRGKVKSAKNAQEFAQHLNASGLKFSTSQAVRGAEQLPLTVLPELAKLADGQGVLAQTAGGAAVTFVNASRSQPVSEEQATPAIEQFLRNERRRKLIADDMNALRAAAKIEYVGAYDGAKPTEGAAGPSYENRLEATPTRLPMSAASAVQAVESAVAPASGVDTTTIKKGLGLK